MSSPASTTTSVVLDSVDSSLWIRLNRPERRNAFDAEMCAVMVDALHDATGYRSVVITGSGGSFCAGGSLGQLSQPTVKELRGLYRSSLELFDAIRTCPRQIGRAHV